nr:hypothetical protein [Tanacetum cinerariifolium]
MFLTHSDEALEIEKFKRSRENKIEFAYDYGNLNASYVNEKINFTDDYFQEIINPDFYKIDSPFQQTSSLKPYVPNVILEKNIIDLEDEVVNLLEKEKANLETIKSLKSKGFESSENAISESENQSENDCHVVEKECGKVENSKVIAPGIFRLSISQSVSPVLITKTSCASKCGERETSSAYVCNDAMNVSCNPRMCDLFDENNLFIFDDESVRISLVSKMPFRKKPRDSMNVRSKSNLNKSLPRTVHKWLPKMQLLAQPVAKWFPRIVQIYVWIINSGCSKHMTDVDVIFSMTMRMLESSRQKGDIGVFVGYPKESAAFRIYNKRTRKIFKSIGFKSFRNIKERFGRLFQDFYDEYFDSSKIMKSSTTNVETSINEEVFYEVSESFQEESSSSSFNDDVQQSPEEVILPQTITQSISNNMIPNVDKASTLHNVFNERLEDPYFDASTSFHDPSNVHFFYQPYPHEKKWTKDRPLHKIISDPKSSVRTTGQLANSCLFSCLLSFIEPANVAEALRDV